MVLPIDIYSSHFLFHVSNLVDLTRVIDGPNARCAPAQFIHINTPKSKEAPIDIDIIYNMVIYYYNLRRYNFIFFVEEY